MAVVPDFRDNFHLEDLDYHHQRGRSLFGVRRCAGCLHASNSAALACVSAHCTRSYALVRPRRSLRTMPVTATAAPLRPPPAARAGGAAATASAQGGLTAAPHAPLSASSLGQRATDCAGAFCRRARLRAGRGGPGRAPGLAGNGRAARTPPTGRYLSLVCLSLVCLYMCTGAYPRPRPGRFWV